MKHRRLGSAHPAHPARPGTPAILSLDDKAIYAGVLITRAQMIAQCRANGLPETGFGVDWFAFGPPFERHRIADDDLTGDQFPFGLLVYFGPNEQVIQLFPAFPARADAPDPAPPSSR